VIGDGLNASSIPRGKKGSVPEDIGGFAGFIVCNLEKTKRIFEVVVLNSPIGAANTDACVMELSRLTGRPVPAPLEKVRSQLVNAMADSQAHPHGKRYATYGDPDIMLGLTQFLLELGAEPAHVLATNGTKGWAKKVQALFDASHAMTTRSDSWAAACCAHCYGGKTQRTTGCNISAATR